MTKQHVEITIHAQQKN